MIARPSPQQTGPRPGANLFLSILPRRLRPFAVLVRLDKPIGTWLLLWPGLWSVALAAPALPDVRLLALFAAGALVMRSAGCVYNDIVDRDFDARVARTESRPIASGVKKFSVPPAGHPPPNAPSCSKIPSIPGPELPTGSHLA